MVGLIYRAPEYSPRDNVSKDAAILEAVGKALKSRGESICFLHEEDLLTEGANVLSKCTHCVSMARRHRSLLALQGWQQRGLQFLNRPNSVQVTVQSRSTTLDLLSSVGAPVAPYWSYEPAEDEMFQCEPDLQALLPGWVKAMHPRGVTEGDVCRVDTPLEADTRILQCAAEGYTDIIVMQHLQGPLLKAYVVGDKHWFKTEEKVVLEKANACLGDYLNKIRGVLNLEVFGVDFICTESGSYVIDVNDFPSFSACRNEASLAIASLVL